MLTVSARAYVIWLPAMVLREEEEEKEESRGNLWGTARWMPGLIQFNGYYKFNWIITFLFNDLLSDAEITTRR